MRYLKYIYDIPNPVFDVYKTSKKVHKALLKTAAINDDVDMLKYVIHTYRNIDRIFIYSAKYESIKICSYLSILGKLRRVCVNRYIPSLDFLKCLVTLGYDNFKLNSMWKINVSVLRYIISLGYVLNKDNIYEYVNVDDIYQYLTRMYPNYIDSEILVSAILYKRYDLAHELIKNGVQPNDRCIKLCEDFSFIKYLISLGHPIVSTLVVDFPHDSLDKVKYLYDLGEEMEWRALRSACESGKLDIVKFLMRISCEYITISPSMAALYGCTEIIRYFVSLGYNDMNAFSDTSYIELLDYLHQIGLEFSTDVLRIVANNGELDRLRKYISMGLWDISLNANDIYLKGNHEVLKYLVDVGMDYVEDHKYLHSLPTFDEFKKIINAGIICKSTAEYVMRYYSISKIRYIVSLGYFSKSVIELLMGNDKPGVIEYISNITDVYTIENLRHAINMGNFYTYEYLIDYVKINDNILKSIKMRGW